MYDPSALDLTASDESRMRIAHTGTEVTLSAPSFYVSNPLYVDTGVGKEQVQLVVDGLRATDASQDASIANQAANHAALQSAVTANKAAIENALAAEQVARTLADADITQTITDNKTSIETALASEVATRTDAILAESQARITLGGTLRQEFTALYNETNDTVAQLQTNFDAEKNLTQTSRDQLQTNIDALQANLEQVVGGGLDAQKLQDIKEFVSYVNASDGHAALLLQHLCDYVRELKKVVSSITGGTNVPIMDKALEAEANRNLTDAQLAELLTISGQKLYLYSKSITGTDDVDYVETQDYVFGGMSGYTPISAAGGLLAAVYANYQAHTSLLDCDRSLVRIKTPLRLQVGDFLFENVTLHTGDYADSAAGAAFKTVLGLHGQGLVNNLTIKSCVFVGTVDFDAARFKEWSLIDGRTASCTGTILIQDCCFKNSGGETALHIRGPEAAVGTLSNVTIKNCHFTNVSGAITIRGMPTTEQQNAVGAVVVENVTYEHAPHAKSHQLGESVFEFNGVTNVTMKNVTIKSAEGNLFKTTSTNNHYNAVQCWSKARVGANPLNAFVPVNWLFDNVAVQSSSFSSAFNFVSPNPTYLCPIQGQAQVGVQFQNIATDAFAGCEAVVSHVFPANADGVYRILSPQGVEIVTPPSYDIEFAHVLTDRYGATRRQMYNAEGPSAPPPET